jgi:hypothetical protein
MRLSLVALLAAAAIASAANCASACEFYTCAITDDAYPPGDPALDPGVYDAVHARLGFGLSQAGFYNDPAVALGIRRIDAPPPQAGWGEPTGGAVVYGAWGHPHRHARAYRY